MKKVTVFHELGGMTLITIRYPWWLIGTKHQFTMQHQISVFPPHVGRSQGQSRSLDEWSCSFQFFAKGRRVWSAEWSPLARELLSACCGWSVSTGCAPLFDSPAHSQISNEAYLEVVSCQLRCTLPHLSAPSCPSYLFFFPSGFMLLMILIVVATLLYSNLQRLLGYLIELQYAFASCM